MYFVQHVRAVHGVDQCFDIECDICVGPLHMYAYFAGTVTVQKPTLETCKQTGAIETNVVRVFSLVL